MYICQPYDNSLILTILQRRYDDREVLGKKIMILKMYFAQHSELNFSVLLIVARQLLHGV